LTEVSSFSGSKLFFKEMPMKIVATIARYLLGAIFLFFGSNLFFHFLPNPPIPPGTLERFTSALAESHYIVAVAFFQVAPAILLLINRYVPLALALLAPVIVNIDLTHLLMAPRGLPMAAVITLLWILVFLRVRPAFAGLFQAHPQH
jgi:putative oxidoreductase